MIYINVRCLCVQPFREDTLPYTFSHHLHLPNNCAVYFLPTVFILFHIYKLIIKNTILQLPILPFYSFFTLSFIFFLVLSFFPLPFLHNITWKIRLSAWISTSLFLLSSFLWIWICWNRCVGPKTRKPKLNRVAALKRWTETQQIKVLRPIYHSIIIDLFEISSLQLADSTTASIHHDWVRKKS